MSVITDKSGDKSSKRTIAMCSGTIGIILSIFVVIFGCYKEIPNQSLVLSVIISNLSTSLIALGFTIPEWFSKLGGK